MKYLIVSDKQLEIADKLGLKGYQLLKEILIAIREDHKISERALATKYEIGRKTIHQLITGTIIEPLTNHLRTTNSRIINNLHNQNEPLTNQPITANEPNTKMTNLNTNTPVNNLWITEKKMDLSQISEVDVNANTINQPVNVEAINRQARSARSEAEKGHFSKFCQEVNSFLEENSQAVPAKPKKARQRKAKPAKLDLVPVTEETQDAWDVFQHWQRTMGCFDVEFTYQQYSYIEKVLKSRYGKEGAIAAINGCAKSDWHMEKKFNTLKTILSDKSLEDHINRSKTSILNETTINTNGNKPAEKWSAVEHLRNFRKSLTPEARAKLWSDD